MVVEHEGQIPVGLGQTCCERQLHRDAALHVGGPASVQHVCLPAGGHGPPGAFRGRQRDGIEVPGQDHPFGPAQVGARDDRITVPPERQMRQCAERFRNQIGDPAFVAGDAFHVQ